MTDIEETAPQVRSLGRTHSLPSVTAMQLAQQNEAATQSSWRKRRRSYMLIYSAIFAIAYVVSLDSNTAYLYLNFACSEFGSLASFSTIAIVQQLCYAIAKPPIAKLSDVFGRLEAYLFSLTLYVCGYLIVASSSTLQQLIGGIVLQSTGTTGIQVLQSIIIADSTTAKWRGLIIGIVNLPYLINFAVAGPLVEAVMSHKDWRFGFYIWTFVLPLAAMPLLITLFVGQRRARKAGLMTRNPIRSRWCLPALREISSEIDAIGLILFSIGFALLLVPLSQAGHSTAELASPQHLFIASAAVLCAFVFWESFAANPILPYRFLANISVVCICLVGVLDFCSFYLSWTFLSAFIQVLQGWDQTRTGYFASTQNVTSTLTGILVGWTMASTRRYKTLLVLGIITRLIGVAMMVRYRSIGSPTFLLVACQLLQGIGGGSVAITMQVAVQCVVRHSDVAIVTAIELLMTECGAAIGSAVAGMVFSRDLPKALAVRLPNLSVEEIERIFGSLSVALSYPIGSHTRTAITEAWVQVMHKLCIMAALILVPAIFFALAIPDGELPDVLHHHHHHHHHVGGGGGRSISASHAEYSTGGGNSLAGSRAARSSRSLASLRNPDVRRAPSRTRLQQQRGEDLTERAQFAAPATRVPVGRRSDDRRSLRFASDVSTPAAEESDPLLLRREDG